MRYHRNLEEVEFMKKKPKAFNQLAKQEKMITVHEIFERNESGQICRSMYLPEYDEWIFRFKPIPYPITINPKKWGKA